MLVCWALCRRWGCNNMAFSVSWLEVIKGIPNQGIFCSVSYSSLYLLSSCVCPSVCLSVCLSQVGVVQRWLNLGSHQQRHMIAQGLQSSDAKNLGKIPTTSPPNPQRVRQIELGQVHIGTFDQYLAISQKWSQIGAYFLWKANRNSCVLYRMVLFSMTLGDPKPTTLFPTFCDAFHISTAGEDTCFKLVGRFIIACPSLSVTHRP